MSDNETSPCQTSLFLLPVLDEILSTVYVILSMPGINVEVTSRYWVSLGRMSTYEHVTNISVGLCLNQL